MSTPVAEFAIKREIGELLHARARGADRFDPALMRACHPADGTDNHGTHQGLMHTFIDKLERAMAVGPDCLAKEHVIANMLFDFRDDRDIFCESYHVAHETFAIDSGAIFFHIGGRYLDTLRRVEGRWLIQHRDIVYDWSRISHDAPSAIPAHSLHGTRTERDPLYDHIARGKLPARAATPGETMTDPIQRLLDKQDIAEVLYRRARAGDRADAELAHSCYHEGATERHGMFDGLATEFIDVISFTRPKPGTPMKIMLHVVTNILAEFEDADHAFVESYHVAYMTLNNGNDSVVGGRYLDRFERRDGRWAIVHRDVIFDWSRQEAETEKFWEKHPAQPFLFGKRGADDPLYTYVGRGA